MSREVPRVVKGEAFQLWLQGRSYREIRDKFGVSIGTVNEIVTQAKAGAPDLAELRELNMILRKEDSTVYDAIRGGRIIERLGQLGVGLDKVGEFIELGKRVTSEKGAEGECLVDAALRLIRLERETGKAYGEALKEFEERRSELAGLYQDRDRIAEEVQGLKQELVRVSDGVSSQAKELESITATAEGLKELGTERVSKLTKFTEDLESLGYDPEEVVKLMDWRRSLAAWKIDPDKLGGYIKQRGSLEGRLRELSGKREAEEESLDGLRRRIRFLSPHVAIASALSGPLAIRTIGIPCPSCMRQVPVRIPVLWEFDDAARRGLTYRVRCLGCGYTWEVDPRAILANIGYVVLQAEAGAQLQSPLKSR